jgi:hypothetical protein
MAFGEIVKGCNDCKVAIMTGDTPGSNIDVPGIKSFSVTVESDSDEQRGDDAVLATTQEAKSLAVSLTAAAANAAAFGAMTGATVTTSGTTPNVIILYKETSAPQGRYVQLTAQGIGRDATGSAFRLKVLKAGIESGPTWDMGEGAWMEPSIDLRGIAVSGFLAELSNYETLVALS